MRKLLISGMLLLAIFILGGCVRCEYNITINSNKTVDLDYKVYVIPELAEKMLPDMKKKATDDGMIVTDIQGEDGWKGISEKKHLKSVDELLDLKLFTNEKELNMKTKGGFKINKGWFYDEYVLDTAIDFSNDKKGQTPEQASFAKAVAQQISLKIVLNLPVKPLSTNAKIDEKNNTSLVWHLVMGENNKLQAVVKVPNYVHFAIVIGCSVLLAIILLLVIKRKKKKRNSFSAVIADNKSEEERSSCSNSDEVEKINNN